MAIGVVKLTYKQRKQLSTAFYVLCVIEICLGIVITLSAVYVYFLLSPLLYSEKPEVSFVFMVLGMYGFQVVIHYSLGLKISHKCFTQADKKSTRSLLLLWLCGGVILQINLMVLAGMSRRIGHHIGHSIVYSFRYGMQHYLEDEKWKSFIDGLQYKLSCCGIDDYEDWHEVPWLTKYQVSENTDLAKKFSHPEFKSFAVTPWSCCRVDFPLQCLHDPLQQSHSTQVWDTEPNVITDSLNTNGCLSILEAPMMLVLTLFILWTILIFVLNLAIYFIARWVYTGSRNALILNDPKGMAPGWIFGRGDCGYKRGKTIYDIMATTPGFESAAAGNKGGGFDRKGGKGGEDGIEEAGFARKRGQLGAAKVSGGAQDGNENNLYSLTGSASEGWGANLTDHPSAAAVTKHYYTAESGRRRDGAYGGTGSSSYLGADGRRRGGPYGGTGSTGGAYGGTASTSYFSGSNDQRRKDYYGADPTRQGCCGNNYAADNNARSYDQRRKDAYGAEQTGPRCGTKYAAGNNQRRENQVSDSSSRQKHPCLDEKGACYQQLRKIMNNEY